MNNGKNESKLKKCCRAKNTTAKTSDRKKEFFVGLNLP